MAFPMTKIILTIIPIGIIIAFCKTSVVVYSFDSVRIAEITVMLMIISCIINHWFTSICFCSHCVWNFSYVRFPVLMKSYHSDISIEPISNAHLVVSCCMVFLIDFCESIGWELNVIKLSIHVCQ